MKIKILIVLILVGMLLSGCMTADQSKQAQPVPAKPSVASTDELPSDSQARCQPEEVTLENYGDKGKRLANCFVEYPGEPTREDKSYYVVEDICGQFTSEFVAGLAGKAVIKTKRPDTSSLYNCSYYFSGNEFDYVMLNLEYLSAANQQKGQESLGRRVEKREDIPMDNLVVWQEDGEINDLLLVLGPDKFIGIKRGSIQAMNNDQFLVFARALATEIKEYK